MKPTLHAAFLTAMVCLLPPATAATREEVMFSRYMRYQFCMEKVFGQGFYKRLALETVPSRWGPSEPTLSSLARSSEVVQKADAKCRAENELTDEPRPQ